MEYKVTKQHWGDKQYFEGDTREVKNDSDAKELLRMGLIADPDAEEEQKADTEKQTKAAPKPKNKAEKEPENKAE